MWKSCSGTDAKVVSALWSQKARFLSYLSTTAKSFASLRTRNLTVNTYSLLINSK